MGEIDTVLNEPNSPSARFANGGSRASGQPSVSNLPSVPKKPLLSTCRPPPSPPLPLVTAFRPSAVPSVPLCASFAPSQSKPSLSLPYTSPGAHSLNAPTSSTSSVLPHSDFIPYGVSQAALDVSMPLARSYPAPAPLKMTATGGRNFKEESSSQSFIPCVLDRESGSSSQAKKRKANRDASQRYRSRKCNEMQLKKQLNIQQDEIQRYADALRRQTDVMRALIQQRDHYHSEREFFRIHVGHLMSPSALSLRPPSPVETAAASIESSLSAPGLSISHTQAPAMLDTSQSQANRQDNLAPRSCLQPAGSDFAPRNQLPFSWTPLPPFQGWSHP